MGSSTFSSRRRLVVAELSAYAAAFALTAATVGALVSAGLLEGELAPSTQLPDRPDVFFIYAGDDDLGHRVLWHGLGESLAHARAADIVVIGDSRSQLGLREEGLERFTREHGYSVFHLGMGYGEQSWFPERLLERHDLRPKVAVVAVSARFFRGEPSRWASVVVSETGWAARKGIWEKTLQWHVARRLHRWLPRIDVREHSLWGPFVLFRSSRTGSWIPVVEPARSRPVRPVAAREQVLAEQLDTARAFASALGRRGIQLVLTVIPNDLANYTQAEFLAQELDVPLIAPRLQDLRAVDETHLDSASADRFSTAFWRALVEDADVQTALER